MIHSYQVCGKTARERVVCHKVFFERIVCVGAVCERALKHIIDTLARPKAGNFDPILVGPEG